MLFITYLAIQSYFMVGNQIENFAVYILIILYLFHVVLMKFNSVYEKSIKKAVANMFEIAELKKLAKDNLDHFHRNLDTRIPCIEVLNKINFKQEGDIIIFENISKNMNKILQNKGSFLARNNNQLRYRMKPIYSIRI